MADMRLFHPIIITTAEEKKHICNVRNICMDEIIIDPDDVYHHYLRNEYEQLANLVDTVTRERADDNKLRKPRSLFTRQRVRRI